MLTLTRISRHSITVIDGSFVIYGRRETCEMG
jgi:hypothetical protein